MPAAVPSWAVIYLGKSCLVSAWSRESPGRTGGSCGSDSVGGAVPLKPALMLCPAGCVRGMYFYSCSFQVGLENLAIAIKIPLMLLISCSSILR